ncbi:hypothetical protein ACFU93_41760 [Streptomyces sp. NPDC057611]|uniref:hypothetical protein n=1 Tax=Streptomyces sp. NPDC057611 TaxID=3346182 RepID=UPI0036CAE021
MNAVNECAEGTVEMICHTKIARDTTVKFRTQAMVTLEALIVTVPDELREQLQCLPKLALIERCAGLRPGSVTIVVASTKRSQRSLARRLLDLGEESKGHHRLLGELTRQKASNLVDAFGSGADTAAEVLVVVGGNPERIGIVQMRFHQPTIDQVARHTAEGKTKQEIIRCLKVSRPRDLPEEQSPPRTRRS